MLTIIPIHVWDGFVYELRCSFAHDGNSKGQNKIVYHVPTKLTRPNAKGLFMSIIDAWEIGSERPLYIAATSKQYHPRTFHSHLHTGEIRRKVPIVLMHDHLKRVSRGSAGHCVSPLNSHARRIPPKRATKVGSRNQSATIEQRGESESGTSLASA